MLRPHYRPNIFRKGTINISNQCSHHIEMSTVTDDGLRFLLARLTIRKKLPAEKCNPKSKIEIVRQKKLSSKLGFKITLSWSLIFQNFLFDLFHWKPFKNYEKYFLFHLKILKTYLMTFWSGWKNDLIRKDKVNFKIHDVTTWLTKNCNTHIAQYLTK